MRSHSTISRILSTIAASASASMTGSKGGELPRYNRNRPGAGEQLIMRWDINRSAGFAPGVPPGSVDIRRGTFDRYIPKLGLPSSARRPRCLQSLLRISTGVGDRTTRTVLRPDPALGTASSIAAVDFHTRKGRGDQNNLWPSLITESCRPMRIACTASLVRKRRVDWSEPACFRASGDIFLIALRG